MGTEAFCKGAIGWSWVKWEHYTHGRLSPDSHLLPGFQTLGFCSGANSEELRDLAHALTTSRLPTEKNWRAEIEGPREAANRKCPYCRAETLTPTPRQHPRRTLGRPLEEGPERAEVDHPHIRDPAQRTPTLGRRLLRVQCRPRPAPPRALLGPAQSVRPGPDENSTPGTSRCTSSRGRGFRQWLPTGLGRFPQQ